MTGGQIEAYRVWDRTTRLFHWINVVCVICLAAIGTVILYDKDLGVTDAGKVLLKTVHVWFGYVFAANLAWRLVWAFIGGRFARWGAILPIGSGYGASLRGYVGTFGSGSAPRYLGHNPVGRLMVALLLVLMTAQAVSGLVLAGTDIYYPPFGGWITSWVAAPGVDPATLVPYDKTGIDGAAWDDMRAFRGPFITVHYWVFYGLLGAVLLHIVGVLATELREGGGIVSAMFTGRKLFDRRPVDAD